jgi:hypothetical protein
LTLVAQIRLTTTTRSPARLENLRPVLQADPRQDGDALRTVNPLLRD